MGLAFGYFWVKAFLSLTGRLNLNGAANLLLLAAFWGSWELSRRSERFRSSAAWRIALGAAAAVWLLWSETWLPSPGAAFRMLREWGLPTPEYMLDFLGRFFSLKTAAAAAACLAVGLLLRRHVRPLAAATSLLLASAAWLPQRFLPRPAGLDEHLARFHESESRRLVPFKAAENAGAPIDVIVLSVCSLSWQDLADARVDGGVFFSQFDYLFTDFNSVSTYSNPSVIRLLTANRGQVPHAELYAGEPGLSLAESLARLGYSPFFAMNHDGRYGKFLEEIRRFGGAQGKVVTPEGTAALRMFDDSPVYRDLDALSRAWERRRTDGGERAFLFYNSVTLHDGNHPPEDRELWKKMPVESYASSLRSLMDDVSAFLKSVESSGRRAVVLFVPEHGRSLLGTPFQVAGLRDIPLPGITRVPVGVKLIGERTYPRPTRQLRVEGPASYIALAYMVSVFIEKNPFAKQGFDSDEFLASVPRTAFVAANAENTVVEFEGRHWLLGKDGRWTLLPVS